MEIFFATLTKEILYQIDTKKMTMKEVKIRVWRYVMAYYYRQRISTENQGGLPLAIYREMAAIIDSNAALNKIWCIWGLHKY